jgi:hypothetical protein
MLENIITKIDEQNNRLIISLALQAPIASASGKTLVVASTRGNVKSGVMINGKEVTIGCNAYIKP